MTPRPADLTQIARRNGGRFPFQRVMEYIDGTTDVRAHGNPSMPVWGEAFRPESSTWDAERRAALRTEPRLITDYVRSIQSK